MTANEPMLEAVLQALPIQMAVLDGDGTILFVNAAWEAFARENGAPSLAGTRKGINYLAVADQAEGDRSEHALEASSGIRAVLAGELPLFTLEYPCHSPDEQRWFLLYAAPLPGRAGQAVVAHLNITERKLLEEQVSVTNREMSAFLSLVSHEGRTPLTSLNGYLQLVRQRLQRLQVEVAQGSLSQEILEQRLAALQQSLGQMEGPARRMNRLMMDLAEVAYIQSERLELHRAPCDLVELVAEVVEEQQLAWPNREIDVSLPAQAVMVQVDQDRIGQVVTNYLTNALKYAPADRPIEVSLRLEAERVRVEVRDQGPGVPPEKQELIWERFYRIPEAKVEKQVGGNLGLGLYICRSIITQHGGRAGVESAPGSGAAFWFTLPLDRSSAGNQQAILASAAPSGKDERS